MNNFCGIDYGSKLAGTTSICFEVDNRLVFLQSEMKKDADKMIIQFLENHRIKQVFFDAPLSLPKAFFGEGEDFFYREGDRAIGAMSPMFLGGLTARAIKLKTTFEKSGIFFFEAYPGGLVKELNIKEKGYKKEIGQIITLSEEIVEKFNLKLEKHPSNWHQFDSLLAFVIGIRFKTNQALFFGDEDEGGIWV
jgi:uncharacterized protein